MISKKMIKGVIATAIMTMGAASAAHAGVPCPTASDIKGADKALNTVMRISRSTYFVLTGQPAVRASGMDWLVAAQESEKGFDASYDAAGGDLKAVVAPAMSDAMEQQGVYMCAYLTSNGGMNVMALAPQQQGLVFNPSKLNLKALQK